MLTIQPVLDRLRSISLRWKLLIPFLFFAFTGTTILAFIGLASQQRLITAQEERDAIHYYDLFLKEIQRKKILVLSLATMMADNRDVQRLMATRDRAGLCDSMLPTFLHLKKEFHIEQVHFHIPPGTSFLRVHQPHQFGDNLTSYRKTIVDAMKNQAPRAGLELGRTGFGIRGVVPIFHDRRLVGTVEVGHSFGAGFIRELHRRWGMDIVLYEGEEKGRWKLLAGVGNGGGGIPADSLPLKEAVRRPLFLTTLEDSPDRAVLIGPVRNYSGKVVALLQISLDRRETQQRLKRTRDIMIMVGLVGISVSFLLTVLVANFFIRPIKAIVRQAQEIAEEKRDSHIEYRPKDEMGTLTEALNVMLDALKTRRLQIERYARALERRVDERTADLVASEEKYRTLVENVPLIVYRILPDGTTEFINSALTEILGYTVEEAVGDRDFWCKQIWGCDQAQFAEVWGETFQGGEEYRVERRVKDKIGHVLTFIDHSLPARNADGEIRWVDGIMMDITELKGLQDKALRTEEIRVLGEISAHVAHAIRNPLSSAGGFARRLRDSLPADDPHHRLAEIIVKEAARMEDFLKVLLSSIRPFDLSYGEVDVNRLLVSWLQRLEGSLRTREITVLQSYFPALPKILADEERLSEAFENLLKHALVLMPEKEVLHVSTSRAGDRIVVSIRHRAHHLSEDDMDKFFFPHIEEKAEWSILDLSFSRRIIHRHGGQINVTREEGDELFMQVVLPLGPVPQ
ncbi:MAG: PAS domain S-box protein [Deltaproteobacteria bacterium]|nr:PAS domain S-box protein [Deltaproteobacteria bacterium]